MSYLEADTYFALVPEWLLDSGVSERAIFVYARLSRYADQDGRAWPSRATLAELCRCSTKSVDRALQELVSAQALTIRRRFARDGGWTSSEYLLRRNTPRDTAVARGRATGVQ